MRAEINLRPTELAEFAEELFPVLHVGIIRLIRAKETPDRCQLTLRLAGVNLNRDRKCKTGVVGGDCIRCDQSAREQKRGRQACHNYFIY